jgi:myo-inositol-1(or 4)-monophosphatase
MTLTSYAAEHAVVEPTLRGFRARLLALPKEVADKGGDKGPLTELDLAMDAELSAKLLAAFPADAWISEESPERPGGRRTWIVDPIDGTRECVAGIPEWAVSVGLWQDGRPLAGWIYSPPSDRLWFGGPGFGATENGTPVQVRRAAALGDAVVGVSRTDLTKGRIPPVEPAPAGIGSIAYKLGLVAAGQIDATVSVTPKNIWDIAGGIPLVLGAGGAVIRFDDGAPLDEWTGGGLIEGGLVAGHPDWAEALRDLYRGVGV